MGDQRSRVEARGYEAASAPKLVAEVVMRLGPLDRRAPTIEEIACGLAMSVRTLRRKLTALNTSYSEILQEVRLARAEALLLNSNLTVECISEELGYTEPSNFRQAFRRWTGCSPRRYRGLLAVRSAAQASHVTQTASLYDRRVGRLA